MRTCIRLLAALALAAPIASAGAQGGAMWVDPLGRMMTLHVPGPAGPVATPRARAAGDMAGLFKRLCLETDGDPARLASATSAAGLTAAPYAFQWGRKAPPVTLNLWTGEGLILSQSAGFFAAQIPQCNATFYLPDGAGRQEVSDALAAALGSPPSNAAKAVDKKGRPKKYFNPEWAIDGPSGARIVTVFVEAGDQRNPGHRVQMSVRAAKKAAR